MENLLPYIYKCDVIDTTEEKSTTYYIDMRLGSYINPETMHYKYKQARCLFVYNIKQVLSVNRHDNIFEIVCQSYNNKIHITNVIYIERIGMFFTDEYDPYKLINAIFQRAEYNKDLYDYLRPTCKRYDMSYIPRYKECSLLLHEKNTRYNNPISGKKNIQDRYWTNIADCKVNKVSKIKLSNKKLDNGYETDDEIETNTDLSINKDKIETNTDLDINKDEISYVNKFHVGRYNKKLQKNKIHPLAGNLHNRDEKKSKYNSGRQKLIKMYYDTECMDDIKKSIDNINIIDNVGDITDTSITEHNTSSDAFNDCNIDINVDNVDNVDNVNCIDDVKIDEQNLLIEHAVEQLKIKETE